MAMEPARKSRRLNPNQPSDEPYLVHPSLANIKGIWPASKPGGVMSWRNVFPEDRPEELESWMKRGIQSKTIVIQFPAEGITTNQKATLVEYIKLATGLSCVEKVLANFDAVPTRPARGFGRQVNGEDIEDVMMTQPPPSPNDIHVVMIAHDLYAYGLNYMFGYGHANARMSVLSLRRWADTYEADTAYFMRGLMHTLLHCILICLKMRHCTINLCIMNGCNSMDEHETAPSDLCPQCLSKVIMLAPQDIKGRYMALAALHASIGLEKDAAELMRFHDTV